MINAVCYNVTGSVVNCAAVAMPTNDTDYCNNVLMEVCVYNYYDVSVLTDCYHGSWSIISLIMVLMVSLILMLLLLLIMFPW